MKLSIIVPIYNAEEYLEECIESILPELEEDIELLLIDDGSKDSSYEIAQRYEKNNISILHHENHGVSFTRNRGIAEATGTYIMFVGADDRLSLGWSESVLKGCGSRADVIYYSSELTGLSDKIKKVNIIHGIFGIVDGSSLGNMSSPCSKLYRREFLVQNHIQFDAKLINGEDGVFNLEAILRTEKYELYPKSFYQYRIYTGSSSKRYSESFFESNLRYFSLVEKLLKDGKIKEEEIRRCLSYAVTYSVYLYLYLVSTIEEKSKRSSALMNLKNPRLREYTRKYRKSKECNKIIQLIYWFVQHGMVFVGEQIVWLRNAVRRQQKQELRWLYI